MIITKRLLSLAALAAVIGFTSCDSDDDKKDSTQLSKTEAKAKISSFNTNAKADLQDLSDADGLKAIKDLFDLVETDDPFGRVGADRKKLRHFFRQKSKSFKSIFAENAAGRTAQEPFNFEANLGIYAWNPELGEVGEFEYISNAEVIEIQFPTEGSTTNDAKLTLTDYSEIEFYDEEFDEIYYEPTSLNASLHVDQVKVASIYLEAEWSQDGFPLAASLMLQVAPYKLNIEFDDSSTTSSYVNISLLQNQETLIATAATVKYKDASKGEGSVASIEGYVQVENLKLQGTINGDALNEQDVNWNNAIKLALYDGDQKLGDIIHVDENGAYVAYLQYADGSKEKLETVLQPVVDEIENLRGDLDINS